MLTFWIRHFFYLVFMKTIVGGFVIRIPYNIQLNKCYLYVIRERQEVYSNQCSSKPPQFCIMYPYVSFSLFFFLNSKGEHPNCCLTNFPKKEGLGKSIMLQISLMLRLVSSSK